MPPDADVAEVPAPEVVEAPVVEPAAENPPAPDDDSTLDAWETPEPRSSTDAAPEPPEEPTPAEPELSDRTKRGVRRGFSRLVDKYLAAEDDAERKKILDAAHADERAHLRWLGDRQSARRAAKELPTSVADEVNAAFQKYADIDQLQKDDPYGFAERLTQDVEFEDKVLEFRAYLKQIGLPTNTTVADARDFVRKHNEGVRAKEQRTAQNPYDPDALYDEFITRPEWAQLSLEDQEALDPINFEGTDTQRALAMERAYGRLSADVAKAPALAKVQALNGRAQASRARAEAAPPRHEGGPPPPADYQTVRKRYLEKVAAGTLTESDRQEYGRARLARFGPD